MNHENWLSRPSVSRALELRADGRERDQLVYLDVWPQFRPTDSGVSLQSPSDFPQETPSRPILCTESPQIASWWKKRVRSTDETEAAIISFCQLPGVSEGERLLPERFRLLSSSKRAVGGWIFLFAGAVLCI